MYMYYLLGYKYFGDLETMEKYYEQNLILINDNATQQQQASTSSPEVNSDSSKDSAGSKKSRYDKFTGFGNLLRNVDKNLRLKV